MKMTNNFALESLSVDYFMIDLLLMWLVDVSSDLAADEARQLCPFPEEWHVQDIPDEGDGRETTGTAPWSDGGSQ